MNLLSLEDVGVTLLDAPLFAGVTLGIDEGERIGFLGANGAGKSTFLKVLQGVVEPDTGTVARNRDLTLSALEQHPAFAPGTTLREFCFHGSPAGRVPAEDGPVLDRFRSLCRELGLLDPAAPVDTLSGGMLRKASIARCLARDARFLTLDEPTNHLDLDTIEWLEARLRRHAGGFVMVTHDRWFLDAACTAIMEIDDRRVYKYPGNYTRYLELRAGREQAAEHAERRRATILRRELEWLQRGPRARTGKDKGRVQRAHDLAAAAPAARARMRAFASAPRRLGGKVLELHGAGRSFGGRVVLRPFTYLFRAGERIGLLGPNGSGKTTFLRLVAGEVEPDTGSVVRGVHTVFGHFTQTGADLDPGLTVLDHVQVLAERVSPAGGGSLDAAQFLERFLFPRAMHGVRIGRLSGGEKRRLALVRLLATEANFLLFDEPTNDLDLDTLRLLEDYLVDFAGCLLLVSHDRAFLERVTDHLFVFDGQGGIRDYPGSYLDYREEAGSAGDAAAAARAAAAPPPAARPRTERRGLSFAERREYEGLLAEIDALEKEQKDLEARFQREVTDPSALQRDRRRYGEVVAALEAGFARWEDLAGRAGE